VYRDIAVYAGLAICFLISLRQPFFGALVILATAVLRDTMIEETYGRFLSIHGYEILYLGTILGVLLSRAGQLGEFLPKTATDWGMFGFFLAMIASALLNGVDIWDHKYIDLYFKAMVLYFLLSRLADTPQRVTLVAVVLVAATAYLTYEAWRKYRAGLVYFARPYYGSQMHEFGMQLVITLPVVGALLARRMKLLWRVLLLALIPLIVLVALRTQSRSTYLGVGLGLVLLAWYYRRRWYLQVLALPIIVYAVTHQTPEVSSRLESVWTHKTAEGTEDTSIDMRLEQMRTAMRVISSHPILGLGPREFFRRYREFATEAGVYRDWEYTMHNVPLLILCEEGFIGFFFYYGLLVLGAFLDARFVIRRAREAPDLEPTAIVAAGGLMAFLAWCAYSLGQPVMWTINIYGTVALVVACRRVAQAQLAELAEQEEGEQAEDVLIAGRPATEAVFS